MSYVNLPPETTFAKLDGILRNQRRLMVANVAVSVMIVATSVLASLSVIF